MQGVRAAHGVRAQMKPVTRSLVVVTATANLAEALPRIEQWRERSTFDWPLVIVENGHVSDLRPADGNFTIERTHRWLGSVGAMRMGMSVVRQVYREAEVIVALHDDVEIDAQDWDVLVLDHFQRYPGCGLAGFSGALGLGRSDLYLNGYDPMQLARQDFLSNLRQAELHGRRGLRPCAVACHDGFSLIGRASWWLWGREASGKATQPPWERLWTLGMVHHAYDSAMGLLAHQAGWYSWYLPVACEHLGGRTAVANHEYQQWAMSQVEGGDAGFWHQAHKLLYEMGRGVLPIRVRE